MKKKLLFLLCCAAAAVGCTTDPYDLGGGKIEGAMRIEISGAISQQYTTRVDDGGFCSGDQIGLYGVNYTEGNTVAGTLTDEGNQVDNARYTYNEADGKWDSAGNIYYKDAQTNIDLYAYYPYAHPDSVSEYNFEVAQDQSGNTTVDGYATSDFLWAKAEGVVPSENKVFLHFTHRMALTTVTLKQGEGFAEGEFEALEKSVLALNTTRTATIDLASGFVTATGEAQREGIVMRKEADEFRAIVVPQGVDAGASLFTITLGGVNYRYKHKTLTEQGEWVAAPFTYLAAKQSKFTITVNKKSLTGEYELVQSDCQISDWVADNATHGGEARQYYSVHLDEAGTLEAKILADGKNPAKIKNLKVSGKICADDFYFMRDKMEILKAVNLKESKIVESWYYSVKFEGDSNYHNEYFVGTMPQTGSERRAVVDARAEELGKTISAYHWSDFGQSGEADVIPGNAFQNKTSLVTFVFPEVVTKIGYRAFVGTTLSGALIIPDDCVEIGSGAFSGTNISSLDLSPRLRSIGDSAFGRCSSLAGSLVLPEGLESIGLSAFEQCSMLSGNLVLPSRLTNIPSSCFYGCSFTGDLVIPESVTEIDNNAFTECDFDGHLKLSSSLKRIATSSLACEFQGELIIPKSVQIIGGWAFSGNSFSSVVIEDGSELVKIEERAFADNQRLSEPIVLPEGLMTIGDYAFGGCRNLPTVTIPSTVTTIGSNAFSNCYGMTKLRCDADMPPVVGSGAFNGVGKENLTLQVPESSVPLYQTASGWADFVRISAYRDFSISRKHMRTLNAEYSKTYLLRAPSGESWKVENCPDWVTVVPSSGVGRADVTITVSSMEPSEVGTFTFEEMNTSGNWKTETHNGRAGEIVFLLESKDHRISMDVQQYDYRYGDGDVLVNQTATAVDPKKGVNLVFMGDCFDARDIAMGSYLDGINEAIGYYFAIEPYKSYKEYFNIYTVFGMSDDSGMGTVNTVKDAKFGSQYSLNGITPNIDTVIDYSFKTETVTKQNFNKSLVVMVENTTDYGGICYMWADGSAVAICPMSRDAYPFDFRGIVQHEAGGHGFAKLADEYIYHNAFIQSCGCGCCNHLKEFNEGKVLGWYRNLSTNGDHNTVEWAHLFAHPDYMNIVDMYEGGFFHSRGIYRSEPNSCMNNNVPYYSAISRQEMVERIMRYSGNKFSISKFYQKDVRDASNNDFVTSAVLSSAEPTLAGMASAAKQMPPKYMGNSPFDK